MSDEWRKEKQNKIDYIHTLKQEDLPEEDKTVVGQLRVIEGQVYQKDTLFVVKNGRTFIGSAESKDSNYLRLQEYGISGVHCMIDVREDVCFVQDINSTNGTYIQDLGLIPQQNYQLNHGQRLTIGTTVCSIEFNNRNDKAVQTEAEISQTLDDLKISRSPLIFGNPPTMDDEQETDFELDPSPKELPINESVPLTFEPSAEIVRPDIVPSVDVESAQESAIEPQALSQESVDLHLIAEPKKKTLKSKQKLSQSLDSLLGSPPDRHVLESVSHPELPVDEPRASETVKQKASVKESKQRESVKESKQKEPTTDAAKENVHDSTVEKKYGRKAQKKEKKQKEQPPLIEKRQSLQLEFDELPTSLPLPMEEVDEIVDDKPQKKKRKSEKAKKPDEPKPKKRTKKSITPDIELPSEMMMDKVETASQRRSRQNSTEIIQEIKIMFTGIQNIEHESRLISNLGGRIVEDWNQCTHLVADRIKRTIKFLYSAKYLLKDAKAEKQFGFELKKTVEKAKQPGKGKELFDGYEFYATPNVRPEPKEFAEILNASGGKLLSKPPQAFSDKIIIIGHESDDISSLQKLGFTVHTNEFVLTGILRQETDFKRFQSSF
ncbi:hypothetical protein EDD86DRAFT_245434 [Gorgonomyces haynaldii]|nr:hypothetical protein EDD86DRAFT_245434 [Gorgonomyces haynaldii]